MHLAKWFTRVYAIDVSIDMLNYAQEHLKAENVAFQLVDGTKLPQEGNSVDAIFSAHVFQHFKSLEYASVYFSEAWRVLAQAGTLMIHVPILGRQPRPPSLTYLAFLVSRQTYELRLGLKRLLAERGWVKPPMASLGYPMEYLFGTLSGLGFCDVEVSTFLTKSNGAIHSFVFARKPAQT
jgi:SAM-dependent methyltransferase